MLAEETVARDPGVPTELRVKQEIPDQRVPRVPGVTPEEPEPRDPGAVTATRDPRVQRGSRVAKGIKVSRWGLKKKRAVYYILYSV